MNETNGNCGLPFDAINLNDDEMFVIKGGMSAFSQLDGCDCSCAGAGCGCGCKGAAVTKKKRGRCRCGRGRRRNR